VESSRLLRQPAFRSLWLAGLVSDAGDWLLFIALPIVVYGQTGSALGTSAAFLAELAPGIVLAPVAGHLADRLDRRSVLLVVSVLQALSLLPLLLVHGRSGLGIVYAVIIVQASLSALFEPAKNALLPTLVAPEMLVGANSLIALNNGLGRLVGGPLGGLLLAAGDLRLIVIADAASFALATALIAATRVPRPALDAAPPPGSPPGGSPLRPLTDRNPAVAPAPPRPLEVLRDGRVRAALLVTFVSESAQGIFLVLFILFVARRLGGGSSETGLLRGVQAVGAILGGLVLSAWRPVPRPASLVTWSTLAFGLISLSVWNAPSLTTATGLYVALFIIVGAPGVVAETGLISFLAQAGSEGERGRIFGAFFMVANAGEAVGMIAAGSLTGALGLTTLLNAQGLLYLAAGALAMARMARGTSVFHVLLAGSKQV
jgi:MFS family permease